MARIVVAGAGAIGASIAYHLALAGADGVVLADTGEIAGGATGRAMGGVRQQFTTEAEVRLAQASVRLFEQLGAPLFEQVGYLFLATTTAGAAELEQRRELQRALGVAVEEADVAEWPGLRGDDVLAASICRADGIADPVGVTRELVRRAVARGVEAREHVDALELDADVSRPRDRSGIRRARPTSRRRAARAAAGAPARRRRARHGASARAADDGRGRVRLPLPPRRCRRAPAGDDGALDRWDEPPDVRDDLVEDWRGRLAHRYPAGEGAPIRRAWAGFYDMTPDAHPLLGPVADGVYAACGFSGHGFMQAPAVGAAVAAELLGEAPPFDLSDYRPDRFAGGELFPETLVL